MISAHAEPQHRGLQHALEELELREHVRAGFTPPPDDELEDPVAWAAMTLAAVRGGEEEGEPDEPADLFVGGAIADADAAEAADVRHRFDFELLAMVPAARAELLRSLE